MIQNQNSSDKRRRRRSARLGFCVLPAVLAAVTLTLSSCSGSGDARVEAKGPTITVGVTNVVKKSLGRELTLSSELVPFQEIDVYAKESGYVKSLSVDYGTHVKAGQVMAILEIPELEAQLQEDQAEIKNATNQVSRAQHELYRYQAQYKALHLEYTRLNGVFESQPGIVAQQEVDDAQGKDLAASAQVDAGQAGLEAAQSQLSVAKAKLVHDQSLFDYSRITAPFSGVVTERYANLGTLVQAGTGSSTTTVTCSPAAFAGTGMCWMWPVGKATAPLSWPRWHAMSWASSLLARRCAMPRRISPSPTCVFSRPMRGPCHCGRRRSTS